MIQVLFILEADKKVLQHLLLYIDAIIFFDQKNVQLIVQRSRELDRDMLQFCWGILALKHAVYTSMVTNCVARIQSCILADFGSKAEKEQAEQLLKHLVSSFKKNKDEFSDYILVNCFNQLLLVEGMSAFFIQLDGVELLMDLMRKNEKKLQIMYQIMLCFWIVSFEPQFMRFAREPRHRII